MTEAKFDQLQTAIRNRDPQGVIAALNGNGQHEASGPSNGQYRPADKPSPLTELANRLMDIIEHHEKYRYGGEADGPWRATVFAYLIHKALGNLGDFERIAPYLEAYIIAHQKGMCYAPDDPRLVASAFGIPVEAVQMIPPFAPSVPKTAQPQQCGRLRPEVLETMLQDVEDKLDADVARAVRGIPTTDRYEQPSSGAGFGMAFFPLALAPRIEEVIHEGRTPVQIETKTEVPVEG